MNVRLIVDEEHHQQVVRDGMLKAQVSLDITTADFKAMLVPGAGRRAPSIVKHFIDLTNKGVEVRILHAGVPSGPALRELKGTLPKNLHIRRCPRLHAKAVIVDATSMYLGSANLTGAGLGAKGATRRNIEWGVWTHDGALIDQVMQQFNELWEGARCENCGRRDICPVPLEEPRL
jgi:phosphatidylserine/phosphatidylglycerophosphate/cardiolipin synthase-like enzyme